MNNDKIAIKVENEQQFNLLMRHYEEKGWKWINGELPLEYMGVHNYQDVIEFKDMFAWHNRETNDYSIYTIIPFTVFAQISGIEYEREIRFKVNMLELVVNSAGVDFLLGGKPTMMTGINAEILTKCYEAYQQVKK